MRRECVGGVGEGAGAVAPRGREGGGETEGCRMVVYGLVAAVMRLRFGELVVGCDEVGHTGGINIEDCFAEHACIFGRDVDDLISGGGCACRRLLRGWRRHCSDMVVVN